MKKLFSSTLAKIILLTILLAIWIVCHSLIEIIPIDYVRPTATGLLFVCVLNAYGAHNDKTKQNKDENN